MRIEDGEDRPLTLEEESQLVRTFDRYMLDAIRRAGLSPHHLRRIMARRRDLPEFMCAVAHMIGTMSIGDNVPSTVGYNPDYAPLGLAEQVDALHRIFPSLGSANIGVAASHPLNDAEAWFAIPRWELIAPKRDDGYGDAVEKVFREIYPEQGRHVFNDYADHHTMESLRQRGDTVDAWRQIGETQKGHDILVIPAQFGLKYRGVPIARVHGTRAKKEFGLGLFAVAIMLLTHPSRLRHKSDLRIDCAGDRFDCSGLTFGQPFDVPALTFGVNLGCCDRRDDLADAHYGSATGYIV